MKSKIKPSFLVIRLITLVVALGMVVYSMTYLKSDRFRQNYSSPLASLFGFGGGPSSYSAKVVIDSRVRSDPSDGSGRAAAKPSGKDLPAHQQ